MSTTSIDPIDLYNQTISVIGGTLSSYLKLANNGLSLSGSFNFSFNTGTGITNFVINIAKGDNGDVATIKAVTGNCAASLITTIGEKFALTDLGGALGTALTEALIGAGVIEAAPVALVVGGGIAIASAFGSNFASDWVAQQYKSSGAQTYVNQVYQNVVNGITKTNIDTNITDANTLKELESGFTIQDGINKDVTINNDFEITNQSNNILMRELNNLKTPLQNIITNVETITKQIVQPITNTLSTLISSGIANIGDISIGKTSVGGAVVYF